MIKFCQLSEELLTAAASTIFLFCVQNQKLQSMKVVKVIARSNMTAVKDICRQFTSLAEKKNQGKYV